MQGENSQIKEFRKRFVEYLGNDLDIPGALALVWEVVKSELSDGEKRELLLDWDRVLGLGFVRSKTKDQRPKPNKKIIKLIKKREELRKAHKWHEADQVRQEVEDKGYLIEDTAKGAVIKKK